MDTIKWADFEKIRLVAGTIIEAEKFPQAKKPAYRLKINFGSEIGVKNSSAQLTQLYLPEDLVGKQVLCVVNFRSKQKGSIEKFKTFRFRRNPCRIGGFPFEANGLSAIYKNGNFSRRQEVPEDRGIKFYNTAVAAFYF